MTDFITAEKATELGLSEDQIKGITPLYEEHIAGLKQSFSSEATTNAEKIISGAIESTQKKYGIELPRNQGEKNADYLSRLNDKVVEDNKTKIGQLEQEYQTKLKEFDGGSATKAELAKAKQDLDTAQQKLVEFDGYKEKADKYEPLAEQYNSLQGRVFFQNDKPQFPETVNKYEADAKWTAFTKAFDEKWEKSFDENGKSIAVSKENPHLKKPLAELIAADTELTSLLAGRQQRGMGSNHIDLNKVDGLDFEVPVKADSAALTKAVDDYLVRKGVSKTSAEYGEQFGELYKKAKEASHK